MLVCGEESVVAFTHGSEHGVVVNRPRGSPGVCRGCSVELAKPYDAGLHYRMRLGKKLDQRSSTAGFHGPRVLGSEAKVPRRKAQCARPAPKPCASAWMGMRSMQRADTRNPASA